MEKTGVALLLSMLIITAFIAGCIGGESGTHSPNTSSGIADTVQTSSSPDGSDNWKLSWDASRPLRIDGGSYRVAEVTYNITAKEGGEIYRYTMIRGYKKTTFKGKAAYEAYVIVRFHDGTTYNYTAYVTREKITELTGYILWMPTVFQFVEAPGYEKLMVTGPGCTYVVEDDTWQGDPSCGMMLHESFFDNMWDLNTGFAGGIYADVVDATSLKDGPGYSVKKDGSRELGGMRFHLYNVSWSGSVRGMFPAEGYTVITPELPFPVELNASVGDAHVHVILTNLKLEHTS